VYRKNIPEMHARIDFKSSPPDVDTVDFSDVGDFEEFGMVSLPADAELKQLRTQVAPMLSAFFDVTRAPERLSPFLSSRLVCRVFYSGERVMPSIDDQRCALSILEDIALLYWYYLESTDDELFVFLKEPDGATDKQLLEMALRRHQILRDELRDAGMFQTEHSSRIQQYLSAMLAASPVVKVKVTENDLDFPLPKGEMYAIGYPSIPFPLFLIREGEELRIIGVFVGGG
jgi:hypothetical protein